MKRNSVLFVAYEERENLGVGYMISVLESAGYAAGIIDIRKGKKIVLDEILRLNPILVGFSVIFQYHITEFREMVGFLRENGIKSHFTAGGHYASLRSRELFEFIPSLDSIVRFEGEHTLTELVYSLSSGKKWEDLNGISYINDEELVNNPLRPLEPDLDRFPFPVRSGLKEYALHNKYATILAGRGCIHDCSFCDIREFYGQPPGPNKRIRKPGKVVDEMEFLYHEMDCRVFLFQDDDFPVKTDSGGEWVHNFCNEIESRKLSGKMIWKINCRPDEVDHATFKLMKEHGLFRVFLGIEDGTEDGLSRMNKRLKVSETLKGIEILKNLEISIDFGFMLFQPETTFKSLNENLEFLRLICMDGYMPVSFLKMLPYFETRIEKELKEQGRLKGKPGYLDYDFRDDSITRYSSFVLDSLGEWFNDTDGLLNLAKWARNYQEVFGLLYGFNDRVEALGVKLGKVISESNLFLIDLLLRLSSEFESADQRVTTDNELQKIKAYIGEHHDQYLVRLRDIIRKIMVIAKTYELFRN